MKWSSYNTYQSFPRKVQVYIWWKMSTELGEYLADLLLLFKEKKKLLSMITLNKVNNTEQFYLPFTGSIPILTTIYYVCWKTFHFSKL